MLSPNSKKSHEGLDPNVFNSVTAIFAFTSTGYGENLALVTTSVHFTIV